MIDPASRDDVRRLESRLDLMDASGTRGVAVVGVQVQELAKDVARLEGTIDREVDRLQALVDQHRREHVLAEEAQRARRVVAARWLVMAIIAAIAAVDGPIVAVLLAVWGGK